MKKNVIGIIAERHKIVNGYCKRKGWDRDTLSIEQVLEIRRLKEWQNAGKNETQND